MNLTLPLVGVQMSPPLNVPPTVTKNGGAERRRFWHTLCPINFAPFLKILSLGHIRLGHEVRSRDPTSKSV